MNKRFVKIGLGALFALALVVPTQAAKPGGHLELDCPRSERWAGPQDEPGTEGGRRESDRHADVPRARWHADQNGNRRWQTFQPAGEWGFPAPRLPPGDWKVARTGRLESLPYVIMRTAAQKPPAQCRDASRISPIILSIAAYAYGLCRRKKLSPDGTGRTTHACTALVW